MCAYTFVHRTETVIFDSGVFAFSIVGSKHFAKIEPPWTTVMAELPTATTMMRRPCDNRAGKTRVSISCAILKHIRCSTVCWWWSFLFCARIVALKYSNMPGTNVAEYCSGACFCVICCFFLLFFFLWNKFYWSFGKVFAFALDHSLSSGRIYIAVPWIDVNHYFVVLGVVVHSSSNIIARLLEV